MIAVQSSKRQFQQCYKSVPTQYREEFYNYIFMCIIPPNKLNWWFFLEKNRSAACFTNNNVTSKEDTHQSQKIIKALSRAKMWVLYNYPKNTVVMTAYELYAHKLGIRRHDLISLANDATGNISMTGSTWNTCIFTLNTSNRNYIFVIHYLKGNQN